MNAEQIAQTLDGVRKVGSNWVGRCPSHDDRHASLSVGTGDDGRVLMKCYAGCSFGDIAAALGVEPKELFADEPGQREPDATYDYRDEQGRLLYQVVRLPGKKFRQRRPDGDGWAWKLGDVRRVLYRLPGLLAADPEDPVYVVEGEKDADTLAARGFVATCNVGGADAWRKQYAEALKDRDVVILPDNDDAGEKHAEKVARSLDGTSVRTRIVWLPGLNRREDVTDWFEGGHTADELKRLVSRAPAWPDVGEEAGFAPSIDRIEAMPDEVREKAKSSQPFHVGFLDDIALGILDTDLVVLGAPTGAGKTTLASIFAQNAARNGRRVHYFALEAHDGEIEQRMLFREMAKVAWNRRREFIGLHKFTYARWCHAKCDHVVEQVKGEAIENMRGAMRSLWTFYRRGSFNVDDLVKMMSKVRDETDLIVLDHLHFIDEGSEDEVRAMKQTIKAVSDAIQDTRTPVIAIAHLRKTDLKSKRIIPHIAEFHGSSDITKVATKVVTLAPAKDAETDTPGVAKTYMSVVKDRLVGEQGYAGLLGFDVQRSSYRRQYVLGQVSADGTEFEALKPAAMPWWAENAVQGASNE